MEGQPPDPKAPPPESGTPPKEAPKHRPHGLHLPHLRKSETGENPLLNKKEQRERIAHITHDAERIFGGELPPLIQTMIISGRPLEEILLAAREAKTRVIPRQVPPPPPDPDQETARIDRIVAAAIATFHTQHKDWPLSEDERARIRKEALAGASVSAIVDEIAYDKTAKLDLSEAYYPENYKGHHRAKPFWRRSPRKSS